MWMIVYLCSQFYDRMRSFLYICHRPVTAEEWLGQIKIVRAVRQRDGVASAVPRCAAAPPAEWHQSSGGVRAHAARVCDNDKTQFWALFPPLSGELLARCIPRRAKNEGNLAVDVWCFFCSPMRRRVAAWNMWLWVDLGAAVKTNAQTEILYTINDSECWWWSAVFRFSPDVKQTDESLTCCHLKQQTDVLWLSTR